MRESNLFKDGDKSVTHASRTFSRTHSGDLFDQTLQFHNSPAARSRQVFKPPTDSASLLVWTENKHFSVLGSLGRTSQMGMFSRFYGLLTRP